jgi:hypothetical protein
MTAAHSSALTTRAGSGPSKAKGRVGRRNIGRVGETGARRRRASTLSFRRAVWDRRAFHDKGRNRGRASRLCGFRLARFLVAASLGLGHFLLLLAASGAAAAIDAAPIRARLPRERRGSTKAPNFTPDLEYSPSLGADCSRREIVHVDPC